MDSNTLAMIGVAVVAIVLIALAVWFSKSRKRDLDKTIAERDALREQQSREAEEKERKAEAEAAAAREESAQAEESGAGAPVSEEPAAEGEPGPAEVAEPAKALTGAEAGETPAEPESEPEPVAEPEPESRPEPAAQEPEPAPAPKPEPERPESVGGRLTRLKAKLAKSSNPFGKALFNILAKDNLSETDWEDVEDTLLLADVGAEASEQLVDDLRTDARVTGKADPAEVRAALREKLLDQVGRDTDRTLNADKPGANRPSVIIMVGVNGTGKTTTAGKLARLFVADGKKVVLGAADTFRAAAADQLETWGARVDVPVVRSDKDGADPASVAFEASAKAKEMGADVLIIDTAGRLQNKANLMDELGKIRRVTEKNLPVDEVLLVLDATTGQNGMTQAKVFAEAIGITGVVLSKLDGSAKGGIVISVQKELGVPVKLVGLGEGPDDLAPFDPEGFVDGILA
ncbi:signal recognition particle-docking protein FtsY [Bifidobacterium platyrrhinorum]|uniref:Signal recognition particle receptor FtsY n=1 Tax=Bifidobacterium platyrrhinorum TaxID=2661628 RepID=A0A6L9SS91_9BIFI|nr:signal recognition particle-docking protein FtsY [Bifidobacterium platyrrhinorum]NEG54919.1 signal recognition particle-docking protein FtsY [Bifidobacterium platyrrhinorum]